MFRVNKFWMGPEEKVFNEGFDDLFQVKEDYKIPPPSNAIREKLDRMLEEDIQKKEVGFTQKEGFDKAMDDVFGFRKKEKVVEEEIPEFKAPNSPLQVVQNGSIPLNIVVIEPRSFEDSLEIVNHLKARKSVIVNLQYLDRDISQRVIDFVSGATLALDGSQERVGHGVFIFASMNCSVETESEGLRAYKDLFSKTFG